MIISIESKSKIKVLGFYLGFSGTAGGCNCSYLTSISFSNVKSFEERSGCHSRGHDVRIRGYLRIKMARNVIVPTRAAAKQTFLIPLARVDGRVQQILIVVTSYQKKNNLKVSHHFTLKIITDSFKNKVRYQKKNILKGQSF